MLRHRCSFSRRALQCFDRVDACEEHNPGRRDDDCCAMPSDAFCAAGYNYFQGEQGCGQGPVKLLDRKHCCSCLEWILIPLRACSAFFYDRLTRGQVTTCCKPKQEGGEDRTTCSRARPCRDDATTGAVSFCNYDDDWGGYCERCSRHSTLENCHKDGLPAKGAMACVDTCFPSDGGASTGGQAAGHHDTGRPSQMDIRQKSKFRTRNLPSEGRGPATQDMQNRL